MKENKIGLKSVAQLLDMKFFVPSYQRGYRWTEQQVKDLLEDIYDFSKKEEYRKGEFYCVQPLVVREMNEEEKKRNSLEGRWYEVIDGQQRLTTMYLILTYLKDVIKMSGYRDDLYQIEYQRETNKEQSLLQGISNITEINDNRADLYYLTKAYCVIKNWFEENKIKKPKYCEALLDEEKGEKSNNIRFIWYESVDEDPIKVFTRLNIGKISLTNAELIKALFLNRTNFAKEGNAIRLRQQEIATEWDHIEYRLQNDEFWLFLNAIGDNRPTRIDFIFDLICEKNILALENEKIEAIGTDEYKTFRYFYQYFKNENANITHCWGIVKKYFQTFQEWYDDIELYHYVGFLVEYKPKGIGNIISYLIGKWEENDNKQSFLKYLKEELNKIVTENPIEYSYDLEGKNKISCKPILLFHNIQTVINQNTNQKDKYEIATFYKFPFHLYKMENWDVEHIHSSTDNPEDDEQTQREWLLNVYLSVEEELQEKIAKCLSEESNDNDIKALYDKIKSSFSTKEEWTSEEKNRIWNYTLLDSSTNRSYGNAIFPAKRRVIISKDKGQRIAIPQFSSRGGKWELKEPISDISSFVPPCTKQVFLKYYSPTIADNNYWTKTDAEAYQNDIQECIHQLNN